MRKETRQTLVIILIGLSIPVLISLLAGTLFAVIILRHDPVTNPKGPNEATVAIMYDIRRRVATYYAEHQKLPEDMDLLLKANPDARFNSLNKPFVLSINPDKRTMTILSLGGDGKRGGNSFDLDIEGTFQLVPGGSGNAESTAPWIKDPVNAVWPYERDLVNLSTSSPSPKPSAN